MINHIRRILIGEILRVDDQKILIINKKSTSLFYEYLLLDHEDVDYYYTCGQNGWYHTYDEIKEGNPERLGYVGDDVFQGEDYLCHDDRCFPGSLSGCQDCLYQDLTKQRKLYFECGDTVYDKSTKRIAKIVEVSLSLSIPPTDDERMLNNLMYISYNEHYKEGVDVVLSINPIRHIASYIRLLDSEKIKQKYHQVYKLDGFTTKTWYRAEDLRLVKRDKITLNVDQLEEICKSLCIFGEGSDKCKECKTGKIRGEIKDVISRNRR